ncbi:hypothetical protein F511_40569 [Dorcoceras hygrometricum]|uniref:Uncharacterized protein n=1 Tax=Dorcoceras hygrometricum TaxID=472368 RepID=A0A2Z7C9E2_9LAMI|nr:hypothetical protein F511_40569 [Dorcoceras hygrometricum]
MLTIVLDKDLECTIVYVRCDSGPSPDSSRGRTCSDQRDEEIPSVVNSSDLLVQTDEGLVFPVVDLIRRIYRRLHLKSQIPCEFGWSQAPRRQQGFQVSLLVVALTQLEVPQEVLTRSFGSLVVVTVAQIKDARASGDIALSSPCWDLLDLMRRVVNYQSYPAGRGANPAGGAPGGVALSCLVPSYMPPRCRARGRGQFQELEGQNEDQRSAPSRTRSSRDEEEEVEVLSSPVERMDVAIARFQRMNPQAFNGDESSEDADSWLRNITGLFDRVQYDDELRLSLVTLQLRKGAERCWRGASSTLLEIGVGITWDSFSHM